MPSSHLILCRPLLLLPSIPPSIRVFSNESALHMRWPKYWSFSFSISPSNEHPGLIFRMDWLDLLAVQGTLKSLLQHHSSKASVLWRSAFFTVQLSNPYMTTGKTIALTRWTFVGKVMSLLFNMLSRLVIPFLSIFEVPQMILTQYLSGNPQSLAGRSLLTKGSGTLLFLEPFLTAETLQPATQQVFTEHQLFVRPWRSNLLRLPPCLQGIPWEGQVRGGLGPLTLR